MTDFIKLVFGKDTTSLVASILGYLSSAIIIGLSSVLPSVNGTTTLTQFLMTALAALVALLGRVSNTKVD